MSEKYKSELVKAVGIMGRLVTQYGAQTPGFDEVRDFFKLVGFDPAFPKKELGIFIKERQAKIVVGAMFFNPSEELEVTVTNVTTSRVFYKGEADGDCTMDRFLTDYTEYRGREDDL